MLACVISKTGFTLCMQTLLEANLTEAFAAAEAIPILYWLNYYFPNLIFMRGLRAMPSGFRFNLLLLR